MLTLYSEARYFMSANIVRLLRNLAQLSVYVSNGIFVMCMVSQGSCQQCL